MKVQLLQYKMKMKAGTVCEVSDWLGRYWIGAGIAKKVTDGKSKKEHLL